MTGLEIAALVGLGGNLFTGVRNWIFGNKQEKMVGESLRQQARELEERKRRWGQEDMLRNMLRLKMSKNASELQKKTEEYIPIFDKEREELKRVQDARYKKLAGEDPNDMRNFLLAMIKEKLQRDNHYSMQGLDREDENEKELKRLISNIEKA
ncbi:MAG: hypothetical protein LBU10_01215 [Endomicrobium sp.]|jgi:hypothetical protein|nr:hypothetical protein [Endomicrobium sp.]